MKKTPGKKTRCESPKYLNNEGLALGVGIALVEINQPFDDDNVIQYMEHHGASIGWTFLQEDSLSSKPTIQVHAMGEVKKSYVTNHT